MENNRPTPDIDQRFGRIGTVKASAATGGGNQSFFVHRVAPEFVLRKRRALWQRSHNILASARRDWLTSVTQANCYHKILTASSRITEPLLKNFDIWPNSDIRLLNASTPAAWPRCSRRTQPACKAIKSLSPSSEFCPS